MSDESWVPPGCFVSGDYLLPIPTEAECKAAAEELARVFPPLPPDPHIAAILACLAGAGIDTTALTGEADGARALRGVEYALMQNVELRERCESVTKLIGAMIP